jgi:hypothetical protein
MTDPLTILIPFIALTIMGYSLLHELRLAAEIAVIVCYIFIASLFPPQIDNFFTPLKRSLHEEQQARLLEQFVSQQTRQSSQHHPVEHFWSASTTINDDPVPGLGELTASNTDEVTTKAKPLHDGNEEDGDISFSIEDSLVQLYKQMTPETIQGLSKDTQELIQTQKQLLNTIQNMAPVLQDGRKILDSFKDYFGPEGLSSSAASGNTKDIMAKLAAMSTANGRGPT